MQEAWQGQPLAHLLLPTNRLPLLLVVAVKVMSTPSPPSMPPEPSAVAAAAAAVPAAASGSAVWYAVKAPALLIWL